MNDSPQDRLARLTARPKGDPAAVTSIADSVGARHGFLARAPKPKKRPGRKPSPRTGQLHAKVLPDVRDAIAEMAERVGWTQGQVIEWAWEKATKGDE